MQCTTSEDMAIQTFQALLVRVETSQPVPSSANRAQVQLPVKLSQAIQAK